jgi:intracellular multiplication protein IcmL
MSEFVFADSGQSKPVPLARDKIAEAATPARADDGIEDAAFFYRRLLKSQILSLYLTIAAVLCGADAVYMTLRPPQPSIWYTDGSQVEYRVFPLSQPVLAADWITKWTEAAVLQAYGINFVDYRAQFTADRRNFTDRGWASFRDSFINSGNLKKLISARLVGSAQAQAPPVVKSVSIVNGAYSFLVEFPLVATYQNDNQQVTEHLMVDVYVVHVSVFDHPDGIAIDHIIATPYTDLGGSP